MTKRQRNPRRHRRRSACGNNESWRRSSADMKRPERRFLATPTRHQGSLPLAPSHLPMEVMAVRSTGEEEVGGEAVVVTKITAALTTKAVVRPLNRPGPGSCTIPVTYRNRGPAHRSPAGMSLHTSARNQAHRDRTTRSFALPEDQMAAGEGALGLPGAAGRMTELLSTAITLCYQPPPILPASWTTRSVSVT